MRSLLALAALVACSEVLAQVTLPHDLQPNTKASASKVMENFRALESAIEGIGGCTATQQDNSVLIECADGTSGVIAGAGSTIVIPNGEVGEAPDPTVISTGGLYWEDGNGVVLSKATNSSTTNASFRDSGDYYVMIAANSDVRQEVVLRGAGGSDVFYTQPDCAGEPFSIYHSNGPHLVKRLDGTFIIQVETEITGEQALVYSYRDFDRLNWDWITDASVTEQWIVDECTNYEEPQIQTVRYLHTTYTPPAEWLNAAYPIRVVQKP